MVSRSRRTTFVFRAALLASLCGGSIAVGRAAEPPPDAIEYNREVRPILSENCFQCHGPDKAKRKADLRLDTEDGPVRERAGSRAVLPGDPGRSELYRRITARRSKGQMPPRNSGKRPTDG